MRLFPYQRAIADSIGAPDVERVTLCKGARIGFSGFAADGARQLHAKPSCPCSRSPAH
jgi:phage terminase large subunit GpA-like protein